jgi:hypothetical protein
VINFSKFYLYHFLFLLLCRDGKQIEESNKYSFQTDGASRTIIIKNATLEDVAEYTCVAENVKTCTELELEGEEERVELLLSEIRTDVTVKKGEEVTFTAPFSKTMAKKPAVQWFFNGAEIKTSERVSFYLFLNYLSIGVLSIRNSST